MKSLFAEIAATDKKSAFQTYVLEHGIEKLDIKIPVAATALFEERFSALTKKDKQSITALVIDAGGKIS